MTVQSPMRPLVPPPPDPVPRRLRVVGLVLAALVASVHLALAEQRYSEDAAWVGSVFVIAALVLVIAAAVAAAGAKFPGGAVNACWTACGLVAMALLALFVLSRTTGLPGYHRHDVPVVQIVAMVAEVALAAVAARARVARTARANDTHRGRAG